MDCYFVKMKSVVNAVRSISDVHRRERRQKDVMSSVVLKKGVEERWAGKRVAKFLNS